MKAKIFGVSHLSFLLLCLPLANAQQPIGTVGVQDATVAGALEVSNGRAVLVGNTTVTARDQTAEIALTRGGTVKVCATSGLHVTAGKGGRRAPLMLALDRGAIEVEMAATTSDVVMTPDLRFSMRGDGPLDLQLRVTRNGDTCVENRGAKAPMLSVADQFGEATYELRAGQHVLFEHGSLKEVVDHESSPCGCPPEPTMSVADAGEWNAGGCRGAVAQDGGGGASLPCCGERRAGSGCGAAGSCGAVHAQVSATLSYGRAMKRGCQRAEMPAATASPGKDCCGGPRRRPRLQTQPKLAARPRQALHLRPPHRACFHSIGRFFKRLFGGD